MKKWHKFVLTALVACTAQVGVVNAGEEAKPTKAQAKIAKELAAAIEEMDSAMMEADERAQRIALLVARTTQSDLMGSPLMLSELSRQVSSADLPLVTASAIMSAGTQSPAVLQAMTDAQGTDQARTTAIRQGATNPASYLDAETIALVQPAEVQFANSVPGTTPPTVLTSSPVEVEVPSADAFTPMPPPVQPPGLPVRPPALPYRGQ